MDFIVLDTQPTVDTCAQISVILGRPFLATSNAIINCRNEILNLSFGNMTVDLNVFNVSRQPADTDELCEINMIENAIHDSFLISFADDHLEKCLAHFSTNIDEDCLISEVNSLLESTPLMDIDKWEAKFETVQPSQSVIPPSIEKPPLNMEEILLENPVYQD